MDFPKDLRYTREHEWARANGDRVVVGVTAFAVDQLGDITMVDLPNPGDAVTAGDSLGVVESVKSVSDIYAPVSGEIARVNDELQDKPELVNESPYDRGWLVEISSDEAVTQLEALLDVEAYKNLVAEEA